MYIKRL